jgi:hypothetical protein
MTIAAATPRDQYGGFDRLYPRAPRVEGAA